MVALSGPSLAALVRNAPGVEPGWCGRSSCDAPPCLLCGGVNPPLLARLRPAQDLLNPHSMAAHHPGWPYGIRARKRFPRRAHPLGCAVGLHFSSKPGARHPGGALEFPRQMLFWGLFSLKTLSSIHVSHKKAIMAIRRKVFSQHHLPPLGFSLVVSYLTHSLLPSFIHTRLSR